MDREKNALLGVEDGHLLLSHDALGRIARDWGPPPWVAQVRPS